MAYQRRDEDHDLRSYRHPYGIWIGMALAFVIVLAFAAIPWVFSRGHRPTSVNPPTSSISQSIHSDRT